MRATEGSVAISLKSNKIASSKTPRNDNILLMNKKTITIPNQEGKLNVGEISLVRVDYPHEYLKKLKSKINQLSAPDRLGLLRDSFDLAQSGNSPTSLALELAKSYKDEEDYTVWASISGHISQIDSLLALEPFYEEFKIYGRELYGSIEKKMGWDKKVNEKHTDSLLRGIVLSMLGSFGDDETIKKAQELFKKGKIDPDLKGVVYNLVSENGDKKEFDKLSRMYKTEDNQQEKDRIGRALGKFKIKKILSKTLDFAISKDVRFQNSLQIIASVWHNPNGRYLAWEFVKKNWKLLKERYAGGHYFTRVFGPAGEFTRSADAKEIESFVAKNPVPEAKRTISQVLEQIHSNASWLQRDKKHIQTFLSRKN